MYYLSRLLFFVCVGSKLIITELENSDRETFLVNNYFIKAKILDFRNDFNEVDINIYLVHGTNLIIYLHNIF